MKNRAKKGNERGKKEQKSIEFESKGTIDEALSSCRQIKITLKLSEHEVYPDCGFKMIKGT